MTRPQRIAIVGAGPVGSLAALYAAQRGHEVELYELRPDLRDPGIVPLNFTKSINLALSERGIHAMRHAGHANLLDYVMETTIPMRGRMIHGVGLDGLQFENAQDYDANGRTIFAVDRAGLNTRLLDILDDMPNVTLFFNHKLTGADFRTRKAWFEVRDRDRPGGGGNGRPREIEVGFDLMIGADGAHSAVRYHLMKFSRMDYQQEYIDTLWCEFRIHAKPTTPKSDPKARFAISPNHLHIWPGRDCMFIAIASEDGSFTCTLFMPSPQFAQLDANPSGLPTFFDQYFPGVTSLISEDDLLDSFTSNPHLPLISLKCRPYHYGSAGVILGDAAHAMVPFYGQGMNAGMEDVRILFSVLDKHAALAETNSPLDQDDQNDTPSADSLAALERLRALEEYSAIRAPDAHAINDLALENYVEMRASVLSRGYRIRKFLEEFMSVHFPSFGWQTKYARVSFGNEGYADVVRKSDHQGVVLMKAFTALMWSPLFVGAAFLGLKHRRWLGTAIRSMRTPSAVSG